MDFKSNLQLIPINWRWLRQRRPETPQVGSQKEDYDMKTSNITKTPTTFFHFQLDLTAMAKGNGMKEADVVANYKDLEGARMSGRTWAAKIFEYGQEIGFRGLRDDLVDVLPGNHERRIAVRCFNNESVTTFRRACSCEPSSLVIDYTSRTPGPVHAWMFVDFRNFPQLQVWEVPSVTIAHAMSTGFLPKHGATAKNIDAFLESFVDIERIVEIKESLPDRAYFVFPDDLSSLEERRAEVEQEANQATELDMNTA